jgi:hypothetical protein
MDFSEKKQMVVGGTAIYSGPYKKPTTCPRCGTGTDGPILDGHKVLYGTSPNCGLILSIQCTHCGHCFLAIYEYESKTSQATYIACLPGPTGAELYQGLVQLSPRFEKVHRQAEFAELNGMIDLAAIGYRTALEILIKDYAVQELKEEPDTVANKKLAAAISAYLKQDRLVKTADVVRLLGNDYTHYQKEFPEHDFVILKRYYKIFLDLIATQYDINHPPVSR